MTILLEENSDAIIKVYDLNNTEVGTIDKNNPVFENKKYNKTLYFKSDKETIIYIYHHIKENARNFVNKKKDDILILLSYDCEYNSMKYCFDNGFENYMPLNLELTDYEYSQLIISSFESNQTKIQKGTFYTVYMECEYKLISNHSDIYENSTINEGSNLIDKNRNIYVNSIFNANKKNFFYQIFECNQNNNYSYNEYYASIDGTILKELNNNTSSFLKADDQIELYLKARNECLFNFYQSKQNEDDYNNLEKNANPHFNISFISRNEIKIDILPIYKGIDFDFYFFMYLDKEKKSKNNSLSNKCYMKKMIINNNTINEEIIYVKKIEYKNGTIYNNHLNVSYLETGKIIHSNVLCIGKIFEDVEEYIFFEEKSYEIKDSDFPEQKEEDNNEGITVWVVIGVIIGVSALIALGLFLYFKCKKKNDIEIENNSIREPIASMASEE